MRDDGCRVDGLSPAAAPEALVRHGVVVFTARFPLHLAPECARLLSPEERARAETLRSPQKRASFVAARVFLRGVLSAELGRPAWDIAIATKPGGKPYLVGGGLEFNVSHCPGWCAVAISRCAAVGVDVEPVKPFPGMGEVARNFFPAEALREYENADVQERPAVFFRWWVRIEAALKARGLGLDEAPRCLEGVVCRVAEGPGGVVLGAAAAGADPLRFTWRIAE